MVLRGMSKFRILGGLLLVEEFFETHTSKVPKMSAIASLKIRNRVVFGNCML